MIVKRNLRPTRVVQYTERPLAWSVGWAVATPAVYTATDSPRLILPYAVVASLGAALAIFIALRKNTAFGRWNEARIAWQSIQVASRFLTRQLVAATDNEWEQR